MWSIIRCSLSWGPTGLLCASFFPPCWKNLNTEILLVHFDWALCLIFLGNFFGCLKVGSMLLAFVADHRLVICSQFRWLVAQVPVPHSQVPVSWLLMMSSSICLDPGGKVLCSVSKLSWLDSCLFIAAMWAKTTFKEIYRISCLLMSSNCEHSLSIIDSVLCVIHTPYKKTIFWVGTLICWAFSYCFFFYC